MDNMAANISETDIISNEQMTVIKTFTILTSLFGTVGNLLTIIAIVKGKFHQNPCYLFVLNLNICNLIHCLIFHPIIAIRAFHEIWTSASAQCVAFSYGLFVNLGTELWGYVLITLNRYFCVVHYGLYSTLYGQAKYLVIQIVFCWLFYPVVFLLPLADLWGHFIYAPQKLVCHPFNGVDCGGFCLFIFVSALVTTLPLILYCYSAIIYTYVRSRRKVGHKIARDTTSTYNNSTMMILSVNSKPENSERQKKRSELRMAFTIMVVILVFGSCRLPFMILYLYDPSMTKVKPFIHTLLIYVGSSSNWINPIIYSMTNNQIRDTLKRFLFGLKKTDVFNIAAKRKSTKA